jgi:hypothetical protein
MPNLSGVGGVKWVPFGDEVGYSGVGCYHVTEDEWACIRNSAGSGATYFIRTSGSWVHFLRYREGKGLGAWVSYEYGQKWSISYSHLSSLGPIHTLYPDSTVFGYNLEDLP